jgi:hypothetical protein
LSPTEVVSTAAGGPHRCAVPAAALALVLVLCPAVQPASAQTIVLDVVAWEGDPTPKGPLFLIGSPSIVVPGTVLFGTSVGPSPSRGAIVRDRGSGLEVVVVDGHRLSGGQGQLTDLASTAAQLLPATNPGGDVLFNAEVGPVGGCCPVEGLFLHDESAGRIRTIVKAGDPAPNGNGSLFVNQFGQPVLNGMGQVAFAATIAGAVGGLGNGAGIFRGDGQALTRIVRTGQIPPAGGGSFDLLTLPSMNGQGDVAFLAGISNGEGGVYRGDGGALVEIARTGTPLVPGWDLRSLTQRSSLSVNDAGQVAIYAQLESSSSCCPDSVVLADGSTAELIAIEGGSLDVAAGIIPSIESNLALNDQGQVLFTGSEALFRGTSDGLTPIASRGDHVPGTVAGTFEVLEGLTFTINDDGDVLFIAGFMNGGLLELGLFYFSDTTGLLPPLVQTGSLIDGGAVRQIDLLGADQVVHREGEPTGLDAEGDGTFFFRLWDDRKGIAKVQVCHATEDEVLLSGGGIASPQTFEACHRITAGDVAVQHGGDLTLRAGRSVVLESGFAVESGGRLEVVIDVP